MGNRFHLTCEEAGKRLDVYLSENLALTRTKVKNMLEGGRVRVDGKVAKPSHITKRKMVIMGEIPEEEPLTVMPQLIPVDILYEDEYFLAINKPEDMVVHPSFGHREGTLVNAILGYLEAKVQQPASILEPRTLNLEPLSLNLEPLSPSLRPGIVHRLDKNTTGVIIVAKDTKTQEMLSGLFKERSILKTYRAIVEGVMRKDEEVVKGNIGRHPTDRKRMAVLKQGGRDAVTTVKVLIRLKGFTYIEAYPRTGRTHQIRVHLSHIGHPIVGDEVYGSKKAKNLAARPLLHAYRIAFTHPVLGVPMTIEAPVPADLEEFLKNIQESDAAVRNGL
jgi:23S rRNA pseudouridine1911/1915/1917 synthase